MGKKDRVEGGKDKRQERAERAQLRKERARRQYSKEEWTAETRKLSDQIRPFGLRICDVASDGNCLFRGPRFHKGSEYRAFSDQIEGSQANHHVFRQRACDFIEAQRDWFQPFIEDDMTFDEYVADMRKDRTWGGNIEIQALSALLQVNVNIHQCDHPVWQVVNNARKGAPVINISYHDGQHYCSLRPIDKAAVLPITQSSSKAADAEPVEQGRTAEEKIVMDSTGCKNLELVRSLLEDLGQMDIVIEFLLENPEFADQSDSGPSTSAQGGSRSAKDSGTKDKKKAEKTGWSEESKPEKSAKAPAHISNRQRKEMKRVEKEKDKEEKKREKQKADEELAPKMEVMSI